MLACQPGPRPLSPGSYRPRNAAATSLYRLLQDHLEAFLARRATDREDSPTHPAVVERSLRAFLECGIPRFGLVRFRCPSCSESLFVAFSCKRRGACPSCDGKRAAVTATRALDTLLPDVGYRQWVLVVPKRLRYYIHRSPELAGEVSRLLARELELYYARKLGAGTAAQIHFIQRFGSTLNLHLHVHAVVSDGLFRKQAGLLGRPSLDFEPGEAPTVDETAKLTDILRRKILRRFVRLGAIEPRVAREMLAWEHSGFSLHGATAVRAGDRAGLERLLYYCARPAFSVKRLSYLKEEGLAVYDAADKVLGERRLVFSAVEFIGRLSRLIPPPRKNLVRYYGALGPSSPLRPLLCEAACALSGEEPLRRFGRALSEAAVAVTASARAWGRLLSRVFEVDPLACLRCGGRLVPVAAILEDRQIARVLAHLGLSTDFPKLLPARSPPAAEGEDPQADAGLYEGIDPPAPDDDAQAPTDPATEA